MKHAFRKVLCLLTALTLLVGMIPMSMFVSAADVVVLSDDDVLVDDDFESAGNRETVQTEVGGVVYQAVKGVNAFATLGEGISKSNNAVYVGAGRYEGTFSLSANIALYGAGMNINPNNADWSINPKRANIAKESLIVGVFTVTGAHTKLVINGFTFTGASSIREATSGTTQKGIDISYNCFLNMQDISSAQGAMYFTGTSVRSGRIAYNRVDGTGAAKPITFRNADDFNFIGNYFNINSNNALWLTAEIADGNVTPGAMKTKITDNYFTGGSAALYAILSRAYSVDVTVTGNTVNANYGVYISCLEGCTENRNLTITGNDFTGNTQDIYLVGAFPYLPELVTIKNNKLNNGTVKNEWTSSSALDLSYNYFAKGPTLAMSPGPILYPRYTDPKMTETTGDMQLESVTVTGVLGDGTKELISGVTIDNEEKTVTIKNTVDSTYETVELAAIAKNLGDPVSIRMYSDSTCTSELTGGNVMDYLKKGVNTAYIKLTTSIDNYSYKVYSLTFNRSSSHKTDVTGVQTYSHVIDGNDISITIPSTDYSPNIQLDTASGATYALYTDAACTQKINGTILRDLPAGSSTFYALVTAEDGTTTEIYRLLLTRAPSSATEIISVNSPNSIAFSDAEDAYVGVYSSAYTSLTLDLTVSEKATWKLFKDAACTTEADPAEIVLTNGIDNIYYVEVTSEAGAKVSVYKFIFRSETPQASKEIYSVTSSALTSSVTTDTISISLGKTVTSYTPAFEYDGSYWKLYGTYEGGALSDPVAGNVIDPLAAGLSVYYVQVVALDGSSRVYTLNITRKASADCKLTSIGGGVDYYIDRFDYTATTTVQDEGNFTPTFTASVGASVAVFTQEGIAVTLPVTLRPGASNYKIVVTAEDGTTSNTYAWTITCIGEGFDELRNGVAVSSLWADVGAGTAVYAEINGTVYKAYMGENAFATIADAKPHVSSYNNTIFVMPGSTLSENASIGSINLYGANYRIDPRKANRYQESVMKGTITVTGDGAVVSGFTFAETAVISVTAESGVQITNNIFKDEAARIVQAIQISKVAVTYDNMLIRGNVFDMNASVPAIALSNVKGVTIRENEGANAQSAAIVSIGAMIAGSQLEISENAFDTALAVDATGASMSGYLLVSENTFKGGKGVRLNGENANGGFIFNFYSNTAETTSWAVDVTQAQRSLADNFTANQNSFASIDRSVSVEYGNIDTTGISPVDITENYYGTATPGNDYFDSNYSYKPYYVNAAKTALSNQIYDVDITVDGQPVVDNGHNMYASPAGTVAIVKAAFAEQNIVEQAAIGSVFTADRENFYAGDTASFAMDEKKVAYITIFSLDGTEKEVQTVTLYPISANPVLDVYNVASCTIDDMTVKITVDNKATKWTPSLEIVDDLAITLYSDAARTKKITGDVTLAGDLTRVYGVVKGYEPVTFEIYKKLSSEKAILSFKDAYSMEYTGSNTITVKLDDRKTTVDLTATVSAGATYQVYSDAGLMNEFTAVTAVDDTVDTLYYNVVAADASYKVFTVTIIRITVVDPVILSIAGTTGFTVKGNSITAKISSYNSKEGFAVHCETNPGCTVRLYTEASHDYVIKNSTVFFSATTARFNAVVTSPDGVKTREYTIALTKPAASVTFVDEIPGWAKKAVEKMKNSGVVTGVKTSKGIAFDANGKTTREMMACFVIRMLGIDETQYSGMDLAAYYDDYEEISDWAVNAVKAATALGILSGAASGGKNYVYAQNNITREQFAVVLVRAIKKDKMNVSGYSLKYTDASSISSWAKTYVKIISKLGYMTGSNNKFMPKNNITRAEIVQTFANMD